VRESGYVPVRSKILLSTGVTM